MPAAGLHRRALAEAAALTLCEAIVAKAQCGTKLFELLVDSHSR